MSNTCTIFGSAFATGLGGKPKKNQPNSMTSVTQAHENTLLTPEQKIVQHLKDNGQKIQWLADKVGFSRQYIGLILTGKGPDKKRLTDEIREKINLVLKSDY
jgi:ADP-heptose:LPS heptosyltransferase